MRGYKIDPKTFGVLIVDMQPFFLQRIESLKVKYLLSSHVQFLKKYSEKFPIYCLEAVHENKYGVYGQTMPQIRDFLSKTKVFNKKVSDGLHDNLTFEEMLRSENLESLLITGVNANVCVKDTAESIKKKLGIQVIGARPLLETSSYITGMDEARQWFKKEGYYFDSYQELIEALD